MSGAIFASDHERFRQTARELIQPESVPNVAKWEAAGMVDKDMLRMAGQAGLQDTGLIFDDRDHERDRGSLPRALTTEGRLI